MSIAILLSYSFIFPLQEEAMKNILDTIGQIFVEITFAEHGMPQNGAACRTETDTTFEMA